MRISIIGCKGIPAALSLGGGIETHVEELATRLVGRGHKVTVYVRPYANPRRLKFYKGVRLITLPTIRSKNLDTITHTLLSSVHVLFRRADIVHYHGVGPSTLSWIPRFFKPRAKVVVTFHSRDRFHEKWGWFAKMYLALGEWTSVVFPDATIAVSHSIQILCRSKFKRFAWYIPNGVDIPSADVGHEDLKLFGLEPNKYFFTLCRFIPHKAIDDAIRAFRLVETDMKLAIVGFSAKNRKEQDYEEYIRKLAHGDPRIVFTGKQTGETLKQLTANAYALIHASRSEGLAFSILETMSYGRLVVMSDIPENLELIDHSGVAYKVGDIGALRDTLQWLVNDPKIVRERGQRAREVAMRLYSWNSVVNRTEALYYSLIHTK
ncbi:glycosyltransferase family 4 protein [Candidatus Uhrbacteria bacterium]|nr:glycosyltransferase family 4 protein [Candidatus Uhrbacteria bacterium]